jgi:hypothetical protein
MPCTDIISKYTYEFCNVEVKYVINMPTVKTGTGQIGCTFFTDFSISLIESIGCRMDACIPLGA